MRALITRMMPAAAAVASRPSRSPTAATARRRRHVERRSPAGESSGFEVAEHEIGVGDRRLRRRRGRSRPAPDRRPRSAGPRAGRPRRRSRRCCRRRPRSVFTSTIGVRTGYGPIEALGGDQRLAAPHHRHVKLVPPMSSETKSRTPERSAANLRADDAGRRTGEEERHRLLRGDARRDDTPARAHHERHAGNAQALESLGEAGQVALHDRAQIGVEGGRRRGARTRGRSGPRRTTGIR